MKKIILIFGFILLLSNHIFSQLDNSYRIIYEADKNGNRISGDLEELVEYVQNGNPIRVGWVLPMILPNKEKIEMQHWTDAGFITTLRGHVFAQIRGTFQQGPGISDPPFVRLGEFIPNGWVAIIGSTGEMHQKYARASDEVNALKESGFTDEQIDQYFKQNQLRNVHTIWAIQSN